VRERIEAILPGDWDLEGKRVLDFGCGAGRVLRHFLAEGSSTELWGCDIDGPSVAWLVDNMSPAVRSFRNGPEPPLPLPDGYFDLVWAASVFTHLTDDWSAWLSELRRILAPGGLLVASFLGEGAFDAMVGEPYDEDRLGMAVLRDWQPWDLGGPWVFHSEWWLRAHWGRAFEILEMRRPPRGPGGASEVGHSYLLARARADPASPAELERIDPSEPREAAARDRQQALRRSEAAALAAEEGGPLRRALRSAKRRLLRSRLGFRLWSLHRRMR
jgi:SAM-dependent methyltransferase